MSCGRSACARPFSNMNSAMRVAVVATPGMQDGRYGRGLARQYHPASAPGKSLIEDIFGDPAGHMKRSVENSALWRVDQPCREVLVRDPLRQGFCGDDEHLLRHAGRFSRKHRHAHGRKDIDVVTLARHEFLAGDLDWR